MKDRRSCCARDREGRDTRGRGSVAFVSRLGRHPDRPCGRMWCPFPSRQLASRLVSRTGFGVIIPGPNEGGKPTVRGPEHQERCRHPSPCPMTWPRGTRTPAGDADPSARRRAGMVLLDRVLGQPSHVCRDHADGQSGGSCIRGPPRVLPHAQVGRIFPSFSEVDMSM